MQKEADEALTAKNFASQLIVKGKMAHQAKALTFLFTAYSGLLIFTAGVIIMQGFRVGGFNLDSEFLHWLGGATIGEVGGLAALVYGAVYRRDYFYDILREVIRLFEEEKIGEDTFVALISSEHVSRVIYAEQPRRKQNKTGNEAVESNRKSQTELATE